MPCRGVIFKEGRLVLTTIRDVLTFNELIKHQDALIRNPDFDPSFNHLIDARDASYFALSTQQAEHIVRRKLFSTGSRRAVLAEGASPVGLSRLIEAHADAAIF